MPVDPRRFARTQDSMRSLHHCAAMHAQGEVFVHLVDNADCWWLKEALQSSDTETMDLGPFWLRDHRHSRLWCAVGTWVQWRGETRTVWLYPTNDLQGWRVLTNDSSAVNFELQIKPIVPPPKPIVPTQPVGSR